MIRNVIASFVVVLGLFQQAFANPMSAAVSTQNKLVSDIINIQLSNIESNVQSDTSNCQCSNNFDLDVNNRSVKIQYPKPGNSTDLSDCCTYTNCVLVFTAPQGYQLEVTGGIMFPNDPSASLTIRNGNGNVGFIFAKLGISNKVGTFRSLVNAMTVTISTDNIASSCDDNNTYIVYAELKQLPISAPTSYSLSSDQPFQLIMKRDFNSPNQYWTVTAETGKQVHLYYFGSVGAASDAKIYIIDGTDVNGKLISEVGRVSSTVDPLNAYSSTGGSLTVLFEGGTTFAFTNVNFLFTQLQNDPSECGTSELAFLSLDNNLAVNVQINNTGGIASCPAVLITDLTKDISPAMQLNVSSLEGSMVLYGGLDSRPSSHNEIISFSSMNDVISPMQVSGGIFLIQSSPGSVINLNFQISAYKSVCSTAGGPGAKGLMMSENFPNPNTKEIADSYSFYGNGNDYYEYSINVLHYDLGPTGNLTIKSSALDSNSSKTLTGTGGNTAMQFRANSFAVNYKSNGVGQKGFVLRYDTGSLSFPGPTTPGTSPPSTSKSSSHGLSTSWLWIVAVAASAVVAGAL